MNKKIETATAFSPALAKLPSLSENIYKRAAAHFHVARADIPSAREIRKMETTGRQNGNEQAGKGLTASETY
ncbi:hypothetical protein JCM15908A_12270 [Prevotella dentasini JCM 15908]